ncbi:MAG: DUF4956 domain-containing protein [Intestinimonas sp.]|nr:DUF4956 domain-containing protein [Intestinimonas sp.]
MLDSLFSGLYAGSTTITLQSFCLSMLAALLLGAALTLIYTYKATFTKSFVVTLAMLPAVVCTIIMMVSGNLGAGVAVAGTFSLVRFRSAPGTAKEICAIFLAMAVGLACGMGYLGFAALFTVIMCAVSFLYAKLGFGELKNAALCRQLRITVPEDLDYSGAFDDLFETFTSEAKLVSIKTTNLGSLNRLTYHIVLNDANTEKQFIDQLRCRNGNLEISSSIQTTHSGEL